MQSRPVRKRRCRSDNSELGTHMSGYSSCSRGHVAVGFCRVFLRIVVFAALCLTSLDLAGAKIAKVTLGELVRESDIVLYGQTVAGGVAASEGSQSIALMKPIEILKSDVDLAKDAEVPICNSTDTESTDFKAHPGKYVVFARKTASCYLPVAGMKAVVLIRGTSALTGFIDGEPESRNVTEFIKRVRRLAVQGNRKTGT